MFVMCTETEQSNVFNDLSEISHLEKNVIFTKKSTKIFNNFHANRVKHLFSFQSKSDY
jgi:hypothetical protein